MKRSVSLLSVMVMMFIAAGCTTMYRDAGADYLIRPETASVSPYYTEYEVSDKTVSGRGDSSVLFWVFQFSEGKRCLLNTNPNLSFFHLIAEYFSPTQKAVDNAKGAAVYNACELSDADQLFGSSFEYTITDYLVFAKVECSVKGFPAKVKKIKMLEKRPVILNEWQKIEYITPHVVPRDYSANRTAPAYAGANSK